MPPRDTISGLDYQIDISRPVGERITMLAYPVTHAPVLDGDQFVVAVNNYRRSGGGNFPGSSRLRSTTHTPPWIPAPASGYTNPDLGRMPSTPIREENNT